MLSSTTTANRVPIYLSSPQTQSEWERYYQLRWQLLRKEWQQPPGSERDEYESDAFHIMASNIKGTVLGVGRIHTIKPDTAQIRYMAVQKEHQRSGIGSKLLAALETQALAWQVDSIMLNARDTQLAFYLAHQYIPTAAGNTLYDVIKHTVMHKKLFSTNS